MIASEAEARGANALFAPDPARLATAHAVLEEWKRLRAAGRWSGEVNGERVDRRSARRAQRSAALEGLPPA